MASVIRGSDNFDSAYGASLKAWVNFNGTGTVAIRAGLNVSSITDNGTGDYTINFTNAMADANYAAVGWTTGYSTTDPTRHTIIYGSFASGASGKTTSALRVQSAAADAATYGDAAEMNVVVFR
jgi:hypothetical protein